MDQERIKKIIKDKVLDNDNPYLKCLIIPNADLQGATQNQVRSTCETLMQELGFRFKLDFDFQPECCLLKARKIPHKDKFEKLREEYNYARARL